MRFFGSTSAASFGAFLLAAVTPRTSAATPPRSHELDATYTFDQFVLDFDKHYDTLEERAKRESIFNANLKMILDHNERYYYSHKDQNYLKKDEGVGKPEMLGAGMPRDLVLKLQSLRASFCRSSSSSGSTEGAQDTEEAAEGRPPPMLR